MAVLIETLKVPISDLRWYSFNIFSTQDHNVAVIKYGEYAAVFPGKVRLLRSTGTES